MRLVGCFYGKQNFLPGFSYCDKFGHGILDDYASCDVLDFFLPHALREANFSRSYEKPAEKGENVIKEIAL